MYRVTWQLGQVTKENWLLKSLKWLNYVGSWRMTCSTCGLSAATNDAKTCVWWCAYVLYSVVYNTTPLRLKKIVNRRISIHSISKYYIYWDFILYNIFRNERGMKINEMTRERVKNNSNRVVFLIFFFFIWVVWSKKMSGVEK